MVVLGGGYCGRIWSCCLLNRIDDELGERAEPSREEAYIRASAVREAEV